MQKHILIKKGVVTASFVICYLLYFVLHSKTRSEYHQPLVDLKYAPNRNSDDQIDRGPSSPAHVSMSAASAHWPLDDVSSDLPFAKSSTVSTADATPVGTSIESEPLQGDKVVVIGKLQHEDTDWVAQYLLDWQHAIYTVDNSSLPLHTKVNKGREANAYLTYIISNYNTLPTTVAFVHSHLDGYPAAWHTDSNEHSNVNSLKALNIDFVQLNGYANLRCIWVPGCPDEVQPMRDPPKQDHENESTERAMAEVWPLLFGSEPTPSAIATPCCAQFAVSRDQIRRRPLSDYQRYHQWLMETALDDDVSGRIFEYLWHIIFGQDPVYCPELQQCYSEVYAGRWRVT